MWIPLLLVAAAVLGVAHIGARRAGWRRAAFWLKPLPIVIFMLVALSAAQPVSPFYRSLIVAGLLFSTAGDIFLAMGDDRFVPGLVAFLVAHIFYASAFATQWAPGGSWWLIAAAVVIYALMISLLWTYVPRALRVPVAVYMAAILIMAWLAAGWWVGGGGRSAALAALGAISFVISDATLAWDRFRRPFTLAPVVVMVTYYMAQALIALSV